MTFKIKNKVRINLIWFKNLILGSCTPHYAFKIGIGTRYHNSWILKSNDFTVTIYLGYYVFISQFTYYRKKEKRRSYSIDEFKKLKGV